MATSRTNCIYRTPPSFQTRSHDALNLATRFWADVRLVFRNSAKQFLASPRVESTPSCQSKTNGSKGATFQRAYSSCRFSAPSRPQNSVIRQELICHRRYTSHNRSWEDEALQDAFLSRSQQQDFTVSLKDESLKTASPLHSFTPDRSTPRFDWRRRALSRAPSQSHGHRLSCEGKDAQTYVKRVVPQHMDIEPGGCFYHEVKAYEDR